MEVKGQSCFPALFVLLGVSITLVTPPPLYLACLRMVWNIVGLGRLVCVVDRWQGSPVSSDFDHLTWNYNSTVLIALIQGRGKISFRYPWLSNTIPLRRSFLLICTFIGPSALSPSVWLPNCTAKRRETAYIAPNLSAVQLSSISSHPSFFSNPLFILIHLQDHHSSWTSWMQARCPCTARIWRWRVWSVWAPSWSMQLVLIWRISLSLFWVRFLGFFGVYFEFLQIHRWSVFRCLWYVDLSGFWSNLFELLTLFGQQVDKFSKRDRRNFRNRIFFCFFLHCVD